MIPATFTMAAENPTKNSRPAATNGFEVSPTAAENSPIRASAHTTARARPIRAAMRAATKLPRNPPIAAPLTMSPKPTGPT